MESDINYLIARLGTTDGFRDAGDYLLSIVKSKRSEQAAATSSSDSKVEKENNSNTSKTDGTVDEDAQKTPATNNSSN
jgi:hypothetical protein